MPNFNSDIRPKSLARLAASNSVLACSSFSLIVADPCNMVFSDFQISSKSEYSFSSSLISSSIISKRFLDAASVSFFKATCSIFNWIKRRYKRSISSGLESISIRIRLAASSIKSIALSGNCRSAI